VSFTVFLSLLMATFVCIGLVLAIVMGRLGHSAFAWGLLGLLLGPIALLLALVEVRNERPWWTRLVASGDPDLAAGLPKTEAERTLAAVVNARRNLDRGVTLVRDLGAPGAEAVLAGRAVEEGALAGPRVVAAGPAVTMTGGHIPYLGRVTDGVDAMRAAVRANLALGARCIKVVATGGVLTPGVDPRKPAYTQAELDALVDEAHRLGLTVAAHAIGEGGVAAALRAGVDSIEHGMFLDEAAIELFLATGARLSATFSAPYGILSGPSVPGWIKDRARPAAEAQARSFQAAVQAGVPVVAGKQLVGIVSRSDLVELLALEWTCPRCGEAVAGARPPDRCPRCGEPAAGFTRQEQPPGA